MAYVAAAGLWYPALPMVSLLTGTIVTSLLLDADGEKVAFIFPAPATGDLSTVGFLTGLVDVGGIMKVSFQDVDVTTGEADGTPDQFRTITIALTDDNLWLTTGIISSDGTDAGTKRSVTKGDLIAVVIEFNAFVALDSVTFKQWRQPGSVSNHIGQCYVSHFTTVWAKQAGLLPTFALKYADGNFYHISGTSPYSSILATTINTSTTPDEIGMYFSVPFACKIDGFAGWIEADGDVDIVLYDGDGTTVLKTVSIDKDVRVTTSSVGFLKSFAEITLTPSTNYRLVFKPTTTTNVVLFDTQVSINGIYGQVSGGIGIYLTSRVNAGSWTEVTTQRPSLHLRISALSDGAGGAGTADFKIGIYEPLVVR